MINSLWHAVPILCYASTLYDETARQRINNNKRWPVLEETSSEQEKLGRRFDRNISKSIGIEAEVSVDFESKLARRILQDYGVLR